MDRTSKNLQQFFDAQLGFLKNGAESANAQGLVIRHGHAGEWRVSSKDNMTTSLPLDYEPNPLQCLDEIPPGKIGGQLCHQTAAVTSTYSRPSSMGIGSPAALTSSR